MTVLSEQDVRSVLTMDDLIDVMQDALMAYSAGRARQPLRTVLEVRPGQAFFGIMPASLPESGSLGAKLVTVFAGNARMGLPTHLASIVLLDSTTGALVALMDGRYITESRTAAVSAVSARLLARSEAATLALVGSGVQARSHLEALSRVRTLHEVRVWSPSRDRCEAFAREMQVRSPAPICVSASARDAVEGADIVALVTAAREPVIESDWIASGTHICAVGACRPDQREMDTALVRRARVFVDSRLGALAEAGDLLLPMGEGAVGEEHIAGELGELAAGRVEGRQSPTQVTIFKSLGMAVEDISAAHLVLERAQARGLGLRL
ncbi:MAG TPA: ornithine cyclodeaminase family protein [Vicinamibacterales bacterium]|nr:ornithine cyclodeaminase family protein [Vicinamibacterales bacterium]